MLTKQPTGVASMTVPLASIDVYGERAMAAVASLVRTSGQWAAEAPLAAPGRCAWVGVHLGSALKDEPPPFADN